VQHAPLTFATDNASAVQGRIRRFLGVGAVAAAVALGGAFFPTSDGLAGPSSLVGRFLGPTMVRAEVVLKVNGALLYYRLDRGKIRAVRDGSLLLWERDRTLVTVPVAANAEILLNNQPASPAALRRGMQALTIREGDNPAQAVYAFARR
jgi:hypothetical protein